MRDFRTDEKRDWLRLIRSENVGPVTFNRLLQRFGSASRAIEALPQLARAGGKGNITVAKNSDIDREIEAIEAAGAILLCRGERRYPKYLAEIEDAPPVITVRGNPALLETPMLGIVGARNASLAGKRLTADYTAKIGAAGYTIVSGLARGIDTAAHQAALATGTVAVVAGGADVVYPAENQALYDQIAHDGCIVAESPWGTEPLARHFPRRNRIISGLSLGILLVEAAAKSGSLITARMALEQNREVFAVPGSPMDPRAEGCNTMIREGAHIITSLHDVLHGLHELQQRGLREAPRNWQDNDAPAAPLNTDDLADTDLYNQILENLSPTPIHIDALIRTLNAPIPKILTNLLSLELAGRIEWQVGNKLNLI